MKVVIEPETSFFMLEIKPNYPVDNVFSSGISFILEVVLKSKAWLILSVNKFSLWSKVIWS